MGHFIVPYSYPIEAGFGRLGVVKVASGLPRLGSISLMNWYLFLIGIILRTASLNNKGVMDWQELES
jgi:hypothetical protein